MVNFTLRGGVVAKLSESEIQDVLADLPGWRASADGIALERRYTFPDFPKAMAFMARAAVEIDRLDHHPEWSNVYNRLDVRLTTHDAGGVTDKDLMLARLLDGMVA